MEKSVYRETLDRALLYAVRHTDRSGRMVVDGEIDTKDSGWLVLGGVLRLLENEFPFAGNDLRKYCRLWTLASVRVDDVKSAWTTFAILLAVEYSNGKFWDLFSVPEQKEIKKFLNQIDVQFLLEASRNYRVAAAVIDLLKVRHHISRKHAVNPDECIQYMLDGYLGDGFFNDDDGRGDRSDKRIDAYSAEIIGLLLHYDEICRWKSPFHKQIMQIFKDFCKSCLPLIDSRGEYAKWGRSLRGEAENKKVFLWELAQREKLTPYGGSAAEMLFQSFLKLGINSDGKIGRDKAFDKGIWDAYTTNVQSQGYGIYGLAFAMRFASGVSERKKLPSQTDDYVKYLKGPGIICVNSAKTGLHAVLPAQNRLTKNMFYWHNRITGENDVEVDVSAKFMPVPYFGADMPSPYDGPEIPFLPMLKLESGELLVPRNLDASYEFRKNVITQHFAYCRIAEYKAVTKLCVESCLTLAPDEFRYAFRFTGKFPRGAELRFYFFDLARADIAREIRFDQPMQWHRSVCGPSIYGSQTPCDVAECKTSAELSYSMQFVRKDPYMHGAVLLLESSDTKAKLSADCRKMRELGFNTAVIWPPCFYRNGKRDYAVQKTLLKCAEEAGLGVIAELTGQISNMEYLPDSEYDASYAVTDPDGKTERMQNGLGELNYNHPVVDRKIRRFLQQTVAELKDFPALQKWDIWNETHFLSFDSYTMKAFQDFLQKKYCDIESLNTVWKRSYTDFYQVRFDPILWASVMPDTDWQEFRVRNLSSIAEKWCRYVKEIDPVHEVTADNVMSNAVWSEFDRGSDDWLLAKNVDCFGVSFYPKTGGRLLKYNEAWLRMLTFAGAYSAGNGRFMVAEMQSHCYSEIFTAERVSPDELTSWANEALFAGSCGCIYWKWSPFVSGFQLGGRGLVLADGSFSKRAGAIKQFSEMLEKHPDMQSLRPKTPCAVLYDRTSNFAVKAINNRIKGILGDDQCARSRFGIAQTAFAHSVFPAVVIPEQLMTGLDPQIKVLFLPYQLVMTEKLAESLTDFMAAGGIVAANWPCGDVSSDGRLFENVPLGPLHAVCAMRQTDNLPDSCCGEAIDVQELEILDKKIEVLLRSDSKRPLLVSAKYGKGRFFYFASAVWQEAFDNHKTACAETYYNILCEVCPELSGRSSLPVIEASGKTADYLLIENEADAGECRITGIGKAELIAGKGVVSYRKGALIVKGPKNAVLRVERKK